MYLPFDLDSRNWAKSFRNWKECYLEIIFYCGLICSSPGLSLVLFCSSGCITFCGQEKICINNVSVAISFLLGFLPLLLWANSLWGSTGSFASGWVCGPADDCVSLHLSPHTIHATSLSEQPCESWSLCRKCFHWTHRWRKEVRVTCARYLRLCWSHR